MILRRNPKFILKGRNILILLSLFVLFQYRLRDFFGEGRGPPGCAYRVGSKRSEVRGTPTDAGQSFESFPKNLSKLSIITKYFPTLRILH